MSRRRALSNDDNSQPEVTQDAPTAEPVRDENGWELDQWGLPICGPVRQARLTELGMPDPNEDPDAWPSPTENPDDAEVVPPPTDPSVNDAVAVTAGTTNSTDKETANG